MGPGGSERRERSAMTVLNLGCGTKVSAHPDVINIDWSIYLRLKRNPVLRHLTPLFVSGQRRARFAELPDNVLVHNLARGLPFPTDSVDAVYHSHVLEHLDRDVARRFLLEVRRILKPGGLQRIVVPDLELACRLYLDHLAVADRDIEEAPRHDAYIAAIIEQCVRREARGTSQQRPVRRFIETLVLGDARRQGDTHQWMYDRVNLMDVLSAVGYSDIGVTSFNVSRIAQWHQYGLDVDARGLEYKPGSLYVESAKPRPHASPPQP